MSRVNYPARRLTALVAACGFFDVGIVWSVIHWVVR